MSDFTKSGTLMQSDGKLFGSKIFYVSKGLRHYVSDLDWIISHGFQFPDDVKKVNESLLLKLSPGRPAPNSYSVEDFVNPPRNSSLKMREIAASQLNGYGIEVGAGSTPFPIPLHCHVRYVDQLTYEELQKELYPGQKLEDLIKPDLITDLETLEKIEDNSLDFIVACHVIEHTRNPLGALKKAYQKLKVGGILVLVVPDKEKTFDKDRKLTSLEHIILDNNNPSKVRDKEHYFEFYQMAFPVKEEQIKSTVEQKWMENYSIHFHTWNYESFSRMLDYAINNISPWSSVWSQPTLSHPTADIEFYFVLKK